MREEVVIEKNDIKKMLYFIITKFQQETVHRQGTSSKSDYLGGFIDRWINRVPEDLIFNKGIIKDKKYKVVTDYFVYDNRAEQNAPDVLGLKENDKLVEFSRFNNNRWEHIEGMPHIEIKTFRKDQKMVAVRETQLDDKNYYMFVESDLKADYIADLLEDCYLDDTLCNEIKMPASFIKANDFDIISQPKKCVHNKSNRLGTIKVLNVITGEDFRKYATRYEIGETVLYMPDITRKERVTRPLETPIPFTEFFKKNSLNGFYGVCLDKGKILEFEVSGEENILVTKINKDSIYIQTKNKCRIDKAYLEENSIYQIKYRVFERKSQWTEYIALKHTFPEKIDKTEELVAYMDKIMQTVVLQNCD